MENNGSEKVYIIVALVVGLVVGYFLGYSRGHIAGSDSAREEIKTRLEETRLVEPTPSEVRIISGTIQSIDGNQFVLKTIPAYDPTLAADKQGELVTKTVMITPTTEINLRTVEVNKNLPKAGEPVIPFEVKNTKSDVGILKAGDQVVVESTEDVSGKTTFEASVITKNAQ